MSDIILGGPSPAFLPNPYIEQVDIVPRVREVMVARAFLERHKSKAFAGQLALQMPQDMAEDDPARWTDACGTFYGSDRRSTDYMKLLPEAQWIWPILRFCEEHSGQKACRTRIMTMDAGRCLSYHKDDEKWRYHIPLVSNTSARFLVENTVGNMPVLGAIYRLRTDVMHTALNPAKEGARTHIVICVA